MIRSTFAFLAVSLALVACGGTHKEAEAPKTAANDVIPADGSSAPDPAATTTAPPLAKGAPASETAKASTRDDGSDIIPPFPSAGGKKASSAPAKATKKSAKKKVASNE